MLLGRRLAALTPRLGKRLDRGVDFGLVGLLALVDQPAGDADLLGEDLLVDLRADQSVQVVSGHLVARVQPEDADRVLVGRERVLVVLGVFLQAPLAVRLPLRKSRRPQRNVREQSWQSISAPLGKGDGGTDPDHSEVRRGTPAACRRRHHPALRPVSRPSRWADRRSPHLPETFGRSLGGVRDPRRARPAPSTQFTISPSLVVFVRRQGDQ